MLDLGRVYRYPGISGLCRSPAGDGKGSCLLSPAGGGSARNPGSYRRTRYPAAVRISIRHRPIRFRRARSASAAPVPRAGGVRRCPVHHAPGPSALRIEDEKTSSAVIAANLGVRQVDRAPCLPYLPVKCDVPIERSRRIPGGFEPQEGACVRRFYDAARILEEGDLVRVDPHLLHVPAVGVADDEGVVAALFDDRVDVSHAAQQLPHWQHLHAMATVSPDTGHLTCEHARYPIIIIAEIKYPRESRPDQICVMHGQPGVNRLLIYRCCSPALSCRDYRLFCPLWVAK